MSGKLIDSSNPPRKPLSIIESDEGWSSINFRELWQYRDLLYILTMRDIKVRYKQTFFGATWVIIQPLLTVSVFSLFFGKLAGMPSDGIPYPLFALAGLLPWSFFSSAVIKSANSLVANSSLITKVYFPRVIVPLSAVIAGLMDLLVASVFLLAMMIYFKSGVSLNLLMLPILILVMTLLAVSLGLWLAGLNVKYRDAGQALPFLIQLGFFASPIIYPVSLLPEKWRWVMAINPVTGLIEGFRASLFGTPFDWLSLILAAVVSLGLLAYATYAFKQMEDEFADVM